MGELARTLTYALVATSLGVWLAPAPARAGGCYEQTSEVVGAGNCHRLGRNWGAESPPVTLELGPAFRVLAPDDVAGSVIAVVAGASHRYTVMPGNAAATAGAAIRTRLGFGRFFYAALEVTVAGGPAPSGASATVDSLPGAATVADVAAVTFGGGLGVEAVFARTVGLRGEVVFLAQMSGTDILPTPDATRIGNEWLWRPLVMPRVAVDVWLTPWLTVGIDGGLDLVDPPNRWELGLSAAVHFRSYDDAAV